MYAHRDNHPPRFRRVKTPDKCELEDLVQLISQRVGRCLERQGLLEQDSESAWLDLEPAEEMDAMPHILGSSVSYRIAVGPQQGRKAFMIRTIRPLDRPDPGLERAHFIRSWVCRRIRQAMPFSVRQPQRFPELQWCFSRPAFKRTGEISRVGESKQVCDFWQPPQPR